MKKKGGGVHLNRGRVTFIISRYLSTVRDGISFSIPLTFLRLFVFFFFVRSYRHRRRRSFLLGLLRWKDCTREERERGVRSGDWVIFIIE